MKERELPPTVFIPDIDGWAPDSREDLGDILDILQNWVCPVCEEKLYGIVDIHEGIVTKGDAQSWPDSWKFLINNIYNCSRIHRDCHRHGMKEFYWIIKCQMFGKEKMHTWYDNLPFKQFPRRFE